MNHPAPEVHEALAEVLREAMCVNKAAELGYYDGSDL